MGLKKVAAVVRDPGVVRNGVTLPVGTVLLDTGLLIFPDGTVRMLANPGVVIRTTAVPSGSGIASAPSLK